MNLFLLIQEKAAELATQAGDALIDVAAPAVTEAKMNIFALALKGGWIMIPIALLLFITIGIAIERVLVLNRAAQKDPSFMERIRDYLHDGNLAAAEKLSKRTDTPYSRMVEKGLQRIGHPASDILLSIENQGAIEIARLEKGFFWVATTAAIAPMLGFFGTVTGMVSAFFAMANAGSNVDVTVLSSGIYEALVTTVAGLFVGIPALFLYNFLQSKLDVVTNKMDAQIMDFMDIINETESSKEAATKHKKEFLEQQSNEEV
ncbi:biopolymer transporter ExbB [Bacteroidia bacterium]|nr:biopolymer transporter ExbB [Bacteroidia bacterium]